MINWRIVPLSHIIVLILSSSAVLQNCRSADLIEVQVEGKMLHSIARLGREVCPSPSHHTRDSVSRLGNKQAVLRAPCTCTSSRAFRGALQVHLPYTCPCGLDSLLITQVFRVGLSRRGAGGEIEKTVVNHFNWTKHRDHFVLSSV